MPRKLQFFTRKSHSAKGDDLNQASGSTEKEAVKLHSTAVQTDIVEVCTTEIQMDTVEMCTTAVQTEIHNHGPGERNFLTPLPNSLAISIPLQLAN